MTKDRWLQSALTNEVLVAELLLRLKHSSDLDLDSDSSRAPPPPAVTSILPPLWGHRKNRSKSTAPTTAVANGFGKEHRGSPTTHLSWSGGGGSTSDGYEDSSRPSDLSSGSRSVKANEGVSISSYNKLDQNPRNKMRKTEFCSVKAETRGFILPDLNMTPNEEDLSMMMI